jgi:hypothetical protein
MVYLFFDFVALPSAIILRRGHVLGNIKISAECLMLLHSRRAFRTLPSTSAPLHGYEAEILLETSFQIITLHKELRFLKCPKAGLFTRPSLYHLRSWRSEYMSTL